MAVSTISNFIYQLREFWANEGPPANLWEEAGELCMMLETRVRQNWTGTGDAKLANRVKLNGNIGPNFDKAFATTTSPDGVQWNVHARDNWVVMRINGRTIEFATAEAMISGDSSVADLAEVHATSFLRQKSYLLWSDGTGRIAKGNGVYSVAGNVVTFLHNRSAAQFEVEDVVVLIAEGAAVPASGMPTPRVGTLTVLAVDEDSKPSTMTLSANVNTIAGAVNTDFISKDVFFGTPDGLFDGVFRWLPFTRGASLTTWAEVDRSTRPSRLAGARVLVTPTMTPYQIVAKMGVALKNQRGGIKKDSEFCIFHPSAEIEALMAEAAINGVTFIPSETEDQAKYLVLGIQYIKAAWPGLGTVKLICDHWLHDPNVTEEQDRTYVLMDLRDWRVYTGRTGMTWKQYEDNGGMLKYETGNNQYYAQYGFSGDLFCQRIRGQVVATTRANLLTV